MKPTTRQKIVLAWMGVSGLLVVPFLVFVWMVAWSPNVTHDASSIWLAVWIAPTFALAATNVVCAFVLWHQIRPRLFKSLQIASVTALLTCPFLWTSA